MPITINGTTGISGNDGSAGTPTLQGTDTNTGIFFPAADTIAFAEGGTEVARFDSSGNLGIGTSSPAYRLDVAAADTTAGIGYAARIRANATAGGGALQFTDSAVTAQYGYLAGSTTAMTLMADGRPLVFNTNNTERARIDSSGNLLVGTTTNTNSSRVVSNGVIESTSGGVRFPDGTTQTTAAGALTTAAVLNAYAGASVGAVGTYALCTVTNGSTYNPGATIAGSSLRYDNVRALSPFATAPSGTWRCMGNITGGVYAGERTTVFLRIS